MFRSTLLLAGALALATPLTSSTALAQEPVNQLTYFTISAPFELPGGKVLPAGKYTFKLLDSPSNRHVVEIWSEDQQQLHSIVMAIPAQRMEPSGEPEMRFMETPADMPPAIRTWFYPGRVIGHEFIYPKDHAKRLAAHQKEGVLTTAGDSSDMKTGDLARIDATGAETTWTEESRTAEAQTGTSATTSPTTPAAPATGQTAQTAPMTQPETTSRPAPAMPDTTTQSQTAQTTTPPQTQTTTPPQTAQTTPMPERRADTTDASQTRAADTWSNQSGRTALPRTATPLPLFALLGIGSLVGAGVLRLRG